ncbi:MAG: hypothetical protein HY508_13445 [Acidobacteria bacterium]|nr:hypothetical protein [Acidobacteriota bacterium]
MQKSPALQKTFDDSDDLPSTPEDVEEKKLDAARAALVAKMRAAATSEVESAAKSVTSPDTAALARALRVDLDKAPGPDLETAAQSAIRVLGDLDGDGTPEAVFRWSRVERYKVGNSETLGELPGWVIFLLSWDGVHWRVTELTTGDGLSGVETLAGIWPTEGIVVVEGLSNIPFPAIFRFQDHSASIAWDSRDEKSRYQGYAQGAVEFEERDGVPPAMIVSGRADPGVIRFSPNGQRGFEAATVYFWEDGAYVPKKTEFEENEDYALYRFIAALHLRDFKTAFSLIEPVDFLKDRGKTPVELRKFVEETWPEFVGNSIFDAVEGEGDGNNPFAFGLDQGAVHYVYFPSFSRAGKPLLTGLERHQVE